MTLKHMRILVAVCDCKSVTAAAAKLYLSQPAVSLAIRELEEYYGTRLFDRISRKMYLTDAGEKVYSYATHIVSLFDDLETEIKNWDTLGRLRIGASMTLGTRYLPGFVKEFIRSYPNISPQVLVSSSDILETKLLQNELDFCLVEGPVHSEHILCESLCEDELCIICSRQSPFAKKGLISLEQFISQPLLLREKHSGTREIIDSIFLLHGLSAVPAWESTSTLALINAAEQGLGIAIVPRQFVDQNPRYKDTVSKLKVENLSFVRKFNIIYHKNKFLSAACVHFIELCRSHLKTAAKMD